MKQVLLVRDDLEMSQGKSIAQGSHVSVKATKEASGDNVEKWLSEGGKKIVLRVSSRGQIEEIVSSADDLPTAIVEDLGYTELEPGTMTAGAIGPGDEDEIDEYTGHLDLFN